MTNPADIARALSEAQRRLVIASEPGGYGRDDCATGVEIRGAQYRTARSLERIGVGVYTYGSDFSDLYFNTDDLGLAVRDCLLHRPTANDASTDRTPATVDGCGKGIE